MDYYVYYHNDSSQGNRYSRPLQSQNQRHRGEQEILLNQESPTRKYHNIYQIPSFYEGKNGHGHRYEATFPEHYDHRDVAITKKNGNKQRKYKSLPITPEEEDRQFGYHEDAEGNNSEMQGFYKNGTGDTIINAQNESEEDEEDPVTQIYTLINSEYNAIDAVADSNLDTMIENTQKNEFLKLKQQKWYKNMALSLAKKVKTFKRKEFKQEAVNPQPVIQIINAENNELLGDVLDASQQKEIITQLSSPSPMPASYNMCPEKTKITNLPKIWVFRLLTVEQEENQPIAWTGFDYENQVKIESHVKELPDILEDGRLALYDSHIRQGKMPVIVTPKYAKGYYFADEEQSKLITLEVTFIENNHQKVTFVYRV